MVIVVDPLHSGEARGKLGPLQYMTRRGTRFVKRNSGSGTYYTDEQIHVRLHGALVLLAWQALGPLDHELWNQFALAHPVSNWTGNEHTMSGWNQFMRANWRRSYLGLDLHSTPLVATPPPPVWQPTCAGGLAETIFTWLHPPGYDVTDWILQLWYEGPWPPGRQPDIHYKRLRSETTYADGATTVTALAPGIYHWWLRAIAQTMTARGPWLRFTSIVT